MLNVTLAGRLGGDAQTKTTQGGDEVTFFTVAVDTRKGREKVTAWMRCSMWGRRGSAVAPYLLKGTVVTVAGSLMFDEYDGKQQNNVNVHELALQGSRNGGQTDRQDDNRARDLNYGQRQEPRQANDDLDDHVPW